MSGSSEPTQIAIGYIEELERTGWVTRLADPADFAELHRIGQRTPRVLDEEEVW